MTFGWHEAILPVLDLKQGRVVHARQGRRNEYVSVESIGLPDDRAEAVVDWYQERYPIRDLYLADLDAINGAAVDLSLLEVLAGKCQTLFVDAGWTEDGLKELSRSKYSRSLVPVIGSESLGQLADLPSRLTQCVTASVFSLDLMQGKLLGKVSDVAEASSLLTEAIDVGFQRVLLLDLADVGTQAGTSTLKLCGEALLQAPDLEVWLGGGVRTLADVVQLVSHGATRVLVGSALYHGTLVEPD